MWMIRSSCWFWTNFELYNKEGFPVFVKIKSHTLFFKKIVSIKILKKENLNLNLF